MKLGNWKHKGNDRPAPEAAPKARTAGKPNSNAGFVITGEPDEELETQESFYPNNHQSARGTLLSRGAMDTPPGQAEECA
eukprot:scaffold421330_cov55-Attheya_sp.AAC.3